jgi:hypothetical protein
MTQQNQDLATHASKKQNLPTRCLPATTKFCYSSTFLEYRESPETGCLTRRLHVGFPLLVCSWWRDLSITSLTWSISPERYSCAIVLPWKISFASSRKGAKVAIWCRPTIGHASINTKLILSHGNSLCFRFLFSTVTGHLLGAEQTMLY